MLDALLDDLLRNAAAASDERASIGVSLVTEEHAALLRIEDEGSWISADALESICERAYGRSEWSIDGAMDDGPVVRRRRYYVAKRNADLLGGDIRFDNRPEGGLSVVVSLPLALDFGKVPLAAGTTRFA
jgi:two-component system sensor histidine kinase ChvG